MLEFHGWLSVSASPGETETELEDNSRACRDVRALIDQLSPPPGFVDFRVINGQGQLHFGGLANHLTQDIKDLTSAVKEIARIAPGSYGLIYIRDDEDPSGRVNEFRVLVISRGNVAEHKDPFLSPVIPVIEDPWD